MNLRLLSYPIAAFFFIVTFSGCPLNNSSVKTEDETDKIFYQVTFRSTWSEATHPLNFPSFFPHFSGLIGGTHNVNVTLWKEGDLATPGMESMAETGDKSTLTREILDSIGVGDGYETISGGGIGSSPGEVSVTFEVNPDYTFLTLVSMLAPSPDWFVGVSRVDLMENGVWLESKTIDLKVYDAGTDDGAEYTSSNQDSSPKQPISIISTPPFLIDGKIKPIGQFIISKVSE